MHDTARRSSAGLTWEREWACSQRMSIHAATSPFIGTTERQRSLAATRMGVHAWTTNLRTRLRRAVLFEAATWQNT
jgi:hypothetical protein